MVLPMMIMIPVVAIALTPSCILDSWRLRHSPLHRLVQLRQNRHIAGCKKYVPVMSHAMLAPPPVVSPSSAVPEGATQAQHFISFMTTNRR